MISGCVPYDGLNARAIMYKSYRGELEKLPLEQSLPENFKLILKSKFKSCHPFLIVTPEDLR